MSAPLTLSERNDVFRQTFLLGEVYLTHGITFSLPEVDQSRIVEAVQKYDQFTEDNDPYGEHDFGSVELEGLPKIFWKIDYYDKADSSMGSDDPNDPAKTLRVLTIMLAEEY